MIDSPEILRLIETATLFRGIRGELLDAVLSKAERRSLKPGEKLLAPGTLNEHVYILVSGRLSVQATLSNMDEPIAMITPGECVGEMSVLVDSLVSAYVIASTSCELISIDYASFWSLIDSSNEAARNILNILVQRIRLGNEIMADSLLHHDSSPDNDVIDNLTGLYNHHSMHQKFDRLLPRCVVGKQSLCLILLEASEIKHAGDNNGGLRNAQLLRTIAQTMLTFLRPDDHAARLLGKRFAVLLVDSSIEDTCATAERLRLAISKMHIVMPDGNTLAPCTISAGACQAHPDDTWNTLIARADIALEHSKSAGNNQVECR